MGVFIRKAFKAGPVRFNLSKSGLGLSAGVKGLRLGAGPRGAYVTGGREGLYFRQSVGRSGKKNVAGKTQAASAAVNPVQSEQQSRAVRDDPTKPGAMGPFVPGVILAIIATLTMSTFWVVSSITGIALAALVVHRRKKYAAALRRHYDLLADLPVKEDAHRITALQQSEEETKFRALHTKETHESSYRDLILRVLEERAADTTFPVWLRTVASALHLNERQRAELDQDAFKAFVWLSLADHELTEDEEQAIRAAQSALDIADSVVKVEADAIRQFIQSRSIETEGPTEVAVSINLQKNERCFHKTHGALVELKTDRTYTIAGEQHKEQSVKPVRTGHVYITSKRVLIVGDGTSSIPHSKILDIDINVDEQLVTITKDGRQKPLLLSVPDAIYSAKLIGYLSKGSEA